MLKKLYILTKFFCKFIIYIKDYIINGFYKTL